MNTPPRVIHDFLGLVASALDSEWDLVRPVVRGGVLMHHWFGNLARPVADLDLECFHDPHSPEQIDELRAYHGENVNLDGMYGPYGEYESLVDYGKGTCRYAAEYSQAFRWSKDIKRPVVEFVEVEPPPDGASLWIYGTPGERYYVGWIRADAVQGNNPRETLQAILQAQTEAEESEPQNGGILQIDIASCGDYSRKELGVTKLLLENSAEETVTINAYSQSTMLAAKLSWLLRGLTRSSETSESNVAAPEWHGAAKDIYDAYLLLTRAPIEKDTFQNALEAFCKTDDIDWSSLQALMHDLPQLPASKISLPGWSDFALQHATLIAGLLGRELTDDAGAEMLQTIAAELSPRLGHFYQPSEEPFIRDMVATEMSAEACEVYADWLEERTDARAPFLRKLAHYSQRPLPTKDDEGAVDALGAAGAAGAVSRAWLNRICGSTTACRRLLEQWHGPAK